MERSKFSEEQIVYAIRQAESGTPVGNLCRQPEEETGRLKRLVADLPLDKRMLSETLRKNLRPARRRELAAWFHGTFRVGPVA